MNTADNRALLAHLVRVRRYVSQCARAVEQKEFRAASDMAETAAAYIEQLMTDWLPTHEVDLASFLDAVTSAYAELDALAEKVDRGLAPLWWKVLNALGKLLTLPVPRVPSRTVRLIEGPRNATPQIQ